MFTPHKVDDGRVPVTEYLPAGAITPKVGLALYQNAGLLAVVGGTTKPTYICLQEEPAAVASGTVIAVQRVAPDIIYKTESSAATTSVKLGTKVTLTADGTQVTATATDGVAEVVAVDDTAAGGTVYVRF